jgi:hypothetical protein
MKLLQPSFKKASLLRSLLICPGIGTHKYVAIFSLLLLVSGCDYLKDIIGNLMMQKTNIH